MSTELGDYYNRIELPFSVSTLGAALAREAIQDQDFILNLRQQVKVEKGRLTKELGKRGYIIGETCESCPIFILGHKDENVNLQEELLRKGILTASGTDWENLGKNYVRVNTNPRAEDFLLRL
jgi:histidinol-phosphate aminotransferase